MKKPGLTMSVSTVVIGVLVVAIIASMATYAVVPKGVPEEQYQKLQAQMATISEEAKNIPLKYELTKETAFDITMKRHAWLDWWNNAPIMRFTRNLLTRSVSSLVGGVSPGKRSALPSSKGKLSGPQ